MERLILFVIMSRCVWVCIPDCGVLWRPDDGIRSPVVVDNLPQFLSLIYPMQYFCVCMGAGSSKSLYSFEFLKDVCQNRIGIYFSFIYIIHIASLPIAGTVSISFWCFIYWLHLPRNSVQMWGWKIKRLLCCCSFWWVSILLSIWSYLKGQKYCETV